MKCLKIIFRMIVLLIMIILGFTVVFPEWLDFKDILISEYKTKKALKKQAPAPTPEIFVKKQKNVSPSEQSKKGSGLTLALLSLPSSGGTPGAATALLLSCAYF